MANFHPGSNRKKQSRASRTSTDIEIYQKEQLEQYRAFMNGYVKRINESTFNVAIGGVRIGVAKYTRLAQINLNNRIITFSRYAIENVPERGRRYLVLHELAHVKEASHNKRFWQLVARYEPDYRQIGKSLENAFKENVKGNANKFTAAPGHLQKLFSLDNDKPSTLSSEAFTESSLLTTGIDISYDDELLSLLAQEREHYQPAQSAPIDELDHFLDWIC